VDDSADNVDISIKLGDQNNMGGDAFAVNFYSGDSGSYERDPHIFGYIDKGASDWGWEDLSGTPLRIIEIYAYDVDDVCAQIISFSVGRDVSGTGELEAFTLPWWALRDIVESVIPGKLSNPGYTGCTGRKCKNCIWIGNESGSLRNIKFQWKTALECQTANVFDPDAFVECMVSTALMSFGYYEDGTKWQVRDIRGDPADSPPTVSAPPLANIAGNLFSLPLTIATSSDFSLSISWGDGEVDNFEEMAGGTQTKAFTHTYGRSGTFQVRFRVETPESIGTGTAVATVKNVVPVVSATGSTIDENEVASVSVSIEDPATLDTFGISIWWGDGQTEVSDAPPSATGFQSMDFSHQYLDEGSYLVFFRVTDSDRATATTTAMVIVENVAPTASAMGKTINENEIAIVPVTIADPGTLDTFDIFISWGDGQTEESIAPSSATGSQSMDFSHQYLKDGIYTVGISVTDNDGATATTTAMVIVENVAPTVTLASISDSFGNTVGDAPGNDHNIVLAGLEISVLASYVDVGTLDTLTALVEWGDGAVVTQSPLTDTTREWSHIYTTAGTYSMEITITDDASGSGTVGQIIHVVTPGDGLRKVIADLMVAANDPTTPVEAVEAILDALEELRGRMPSNKRRVTGKGNGGALQYLDNQELAKSLGKIDNAVGFLKPVDLLRVNSDISIMMSQLVLIANSIIISLFEDKIAATDPDWSPQCTASYIADGNTAGKSDLALDAMDHYKDALDWLNTKGGKGKE
jgi:hypothetical protein